MDNVLGRDLWGEVGEAAGAEGSSEQQAEKSAGAKRGMGWRGLPILNGARRQPGRLRSA